MEVHAEAVSSNLRNLGLAKRKRPQFLGNPRQAPEQYAGGCKWLVQSPPHRNKRSARSRRAYVHYRYARRFWTGVPELGARSIRADYGGLPATNHGGI